MVTVLIYSRLKTLQQQATSCMTLNKYLVFQNSQQFLDQAKHSKGSMPHLPNNNNKAIEALQTK